MTPAMGPLSRLACLAGMVLAALAAEAQTVTVSKLDGAAIEAAIAASKPGDTVQLVEGTHTIARALKPKSHTRLIGAGQGKTIVRYGGDKPDVMVRLAGVEYVELAHLTLDGEMNLNVSQGIAGGNARRLLIHHVTIRNLGDAKTFGPHGILFSGTNPTRQHGVTDSAIADCTLEHIATGKKFGCGIRLAWGSSRNQVLGNTIRATGRGGIFGDSGSNDLVIRGNTVSGSGGEGLGIEVWGHCDRCVIEDNRIDHWLSIGACDFCSVRRNTIGDATEGAKFCGIEAIGSYLVVTDNVVDGGQKIGISVSAPMPKRYVYYGHNTVRRCVQWGTQFQGEKGGTAYNYFYRCAFNDTLVGQPNAWYPGHDGHGFRTNGNAKHLVFEECEFRRNGRYGVQLGGAGVDFLSFVRCAIAGNKGPAVVGPHKYTALEWLDCTVQGNGSNKLPAPKPFAGPPPVASFDAPAIVAVGEAVTFASTSRAAKGGIAAALWDFGDGIPATAPTATRAYRQPGEYCVTLVVWDEAGRAARVAKTMRVVACR